jgi:drug/metabolite transporter (DMT)-like permease
VTDEAVAYYNNFVAGVLFAIVAVVSGATAGIGATLGASALRLPLVIAGIAQTSLYLLYYYNLRRSPVWLVKLLLLLIPCFGAVQSYFFLGERITIPQVAGMLIVMAGATVIIVRQRIPQVTPVPGAMSNAQRSVA